jgi:hypothetical protein
MMVGPLAQLYAMLERQRPIVLDGPPSADRPSFDDPALTDEMLRRHGSEGPMARPLPRQYNGPVDWLFNKPPAEATPAWRDPSMQAGPSPPMGRGELARMYGGK